MKSFSSKGKHLVGEEASVGQQLQTLLGWVGPKFEHEKQVNRKQLVTQRQGQPFLRILPVFVCVFVFVYIFVFVYVFVSVFEDSLMKNR